MMLLSKIFSFLRCSLLIILLLQIQVSFTHECGHDELELNFTFATLKYEYPEGRSLPSTYDPIRILFDYSNFAGVSTAFKQYIQDQVLPPARNFLEATLKVVRSSGNLQLQGETTLCSNSISVNSSLTNPGVSGADLVIFITATDEPSTNKIAYSGACVLDTVTNRPIFGRLNYNIDKISASTVEVDIQRDIAVTLHEITHVLGFSSGLYSYFVDPSTNQPLTGHQTTKTVNGQTITVLNLPSLTSRLRTYYNCPTLDGAYLEQQGGVGSATSHFERRVLMYDYMTASAVKEIVVSEFSLALLEGTGWYQVDYNMAEPMSYGKGKGCNFLDTPCMSAGTPAFEEFCAPLMGSTCSWTGRGLGVCGSTLINSDSSLASSLDYWGNKTIVSDIFSDNCPQVQIYENLDCENPANQGSASLGNAETYAEGSKCFMGTLHTGGGALLSPYGFCFSYTCQDLGSGTYKVQVSVGDTVVDCTSAGSISVPNYGGQLNCPDPAVFCGRMDNEGYCKRGCSGRGTCTNKVCVCADGWTSYDCSKPKYTDQSTLCTTDILKSTRRGDDCVCNPTNTTCMCLSGLTTGSACDSISGNTVNETIHTSRLPLMITAGIAAIVVISGGTFLVIKHYKKKKPAPKPKESSPTERKIKTLTSLTDYALASSPRSLAYAGSPRSMKGDEPLFRRAKTNAYSINKTDKIIENKVFDLESPQKSTRVEISPRMPNSPNSPNNESPKRLTSRVLKVSKASSIQLHE